MHAKTLTPVSAETLHAALPQTQCTRCGYPDCAAYAKAIAQEGVPINQCPPGGQEGIARLATLTGQPQDQTLDPQHGEESPWSVAVIDEAWCIGCTLCIQACPVDAIVGAPKQMHTVLEDHCTSCALCLPVCPVDCITMENTANLSTGWAGWSEEKADASLARYQARQARLASPKPEAPQAVMGTKAGDKDNKKERLAAILAQAAQLSPSVYTDCVLPGVKAK